MNVAPDIHLYRHYLQTICPNAGSDLLARIDAIAETTDWENPSSPLDWNNLAVLSLVAAERCAELDQRFHYLKTASENLRQGSSHPLCAAHLALISCLIGQNQQARQEAFTQLIEGSNNAFQSCEISHGLVYLPNRSPDLGYSGRLLVQILMAERVEFQALLLVSEVLSCSSLEFYNTIGMRSLVISLQLSPSFFPAYLKHGIANFLNQQQEGILSLQRARQLAPDTPAVLQSLYLAYRHLNQPQQAAFWLQQARQIYPDVAESLPWRWATLEPDSHFTYVPFENSLALTVEASFNSIVTSVLVAEGDWFEHDMEFWRDQIQPGMVVIDVGANVGVYTFSAAQRVGSEGGVLAIEPFLGCVECLTETCRVNQLPWVKIVHAAASDRNGTVRLSVDSSSELNRVIPVDEKRSEESATDDGVEVACVSLDSLVEQEGMLQVDLLKIDAEGHELQVLMGSEGILTYFNPTIIYENIAGEDEINLPVAEFLQARDYQLFRYMPFVKQLVPIQSVEDLYGCLNIVAIHTSRLTANGD